MHFEVAQKQKCTKKNEKERSVIWSLKSKSELWEMLLVWWSEIEIDILIKLKEIMLRLCKTVITTKGGFFLNNI